MGDSLLDSTTYQAIRVLAAHKARLAAVFARYGLHVGQECMLAQLWRTDGLTQSQLAERLGVSAPAVTKMVRSLVRADLVWRLQDRADARILRICLTDRGRALEEPVTAAWYAVEAESCAALAPEQRAALRQLADVQF